MRVGVWDYISFSEAYINVHSLKNHKNNKIIIEMLFMLINCLEKLGFFIFLFYSNLMIFVLKLLFVPDEREML